MQRLPLRNGSFLSYAIEGAGPPILFIHAPCIGYVNFQRQLPLASEYQLIIPDLRGHGESSPAREPLTMGDIAEDLRELVQQATNQKIVLCGYSQGGSVALEFMLRYPELILGGILASGFSEVNDFYLHSRFYLAQAISKMHGIPLLARSTAASHLDEKHEQEQWLNHGQKTDAYSLEQLYQAGHAYNCTSRLGEIQAPVLLVYGEQDKPMHPYGKLLMKGLSRAEIAYLPGVKHQVITRQHEMFNNLCRDFVTALTRQKVNV